MTIAELTSKVRSHDWLEPYATRTLMDRLELITLLAKVPQWQLASVIGPLSPMIKGQIVILIQNKVRGIK